jgi:hypothetical protein
MNDRLAKDLADVLHRIETRLDSVQHRLWEIETKIDRVLAVVDGGSGLR